jgi:hypothetical protein
MDLVQTAFNVAVTLIGFLGGWILKSVTDTLKEMRVSEHSLRNKVQAMEILVAGSYVRREDLDKFGETMFRKLDKLEERVIAAQSRP